MVAAADARSRATTGATTSQQALLWSRWQNFCASIELHNNEFLDSFEVNDCNKIIAAFAQTVRDAEYSLLAYCVLASGTVRGAVDDVVLTFRDNQRKDPRLDPDGKSSRLLLRQYAGYKKTDPATKQQKALPACVLRELFKREKTEEGKAIRDLAIGAFFFAMRSCEYLKVPASETKKTKRLRCRIFSFY